MFGNLRKALYTTAKILGDVNAVSRGPKATGKRIGRRIVGKATQKTMNKMFK